MVSKGGGVGGVGEVVRYAIAGLANTIVGYWVFWGVLHWIAVSPAIANAIGYAVALCVAFLLNRYFVFSGSTISMVIVMRFLLAFFGAFVINQVVLFVLIHLLALSPEMAQVFAMLTYSVVFYLMNKYYAFRSRAALGGKGPR